MSASYGAADLGTWKRSDSTTVGSVAQRSVNAETSAFKLVNAPREEASEFLALGNFSGAVARATGDERKFLDAGGSAAFGEGKILAGIAGAAPDEHQYFVDEARPGADKDQNVDDAAHHVLGHAKCLPCHAYRVQKTRGATPCLVEPMAIGCTTHQFDEKSPAMRTGRKKFHP